MIELTEQQMLAPENPEATPPRVVNPRTKETFVLLRIDEYERRQEQAYDDSPWTREELQSLAWEAALRPEVGGIRTRQDDFLGLPRGRLVLSEFSRRLVGRQG